MKLKENIKEFWWAYLYIIMIVLFCIGGILMQLFVPDCCGGFVRFS
jgi:hypothetical protein